MPENQFERRVRELASRLRRRRMAAMFVCGESNVKSLTGVDCDNACFVVPADGMPEFFTDFRYVPAVRRLAPWWRTVDAGRDIFAAAARFVRSLPLRRAFPVRVAYEGSIAAARLAAMRRALPSARFVEAGKEVSALRAVKTPGEIAKIAAAAKLNDEIWRMAKREIRHGMTEREIARAIRILMDAYGDGEAFSTIVCAGANAAECHHVPDGTVWRRGDALLVDMGVRLDGVCSDMTRCIKAAGDAGYGKIYATVLEANRAAIAAVRPGLSCAALDRVARRVISAAGHGRAFGHSLGHGVGYDVHEAPSASRRSEETLEPGMVVTIEPGIYLPGRLGVRIEDLVLVTESGCEILSKSAK